MKTKRRWLNSLMTEADKTEVQTTWARGSRRAELKARVAARVSMKSVAQS